MTTRAEIPTNAREGGKNVDAAQDRPVVREDPDPLDRKARVPQETANVLGL